MSNAKSIVEQVAFDEVAAAVTGAQVFQDVPNDQQGDIVVIGDMRSFRFSTKEASADQIVEISIVTLVIADERAPLLAIQEQIETALDGQTIDRDGWRLDFTFKDDDAVLGEEGAGYVGVTTFSVVAIAP